MCHKLTTAHKMSDGKGDPDAMAMAMAIRLKSSSGYGHFNRRVNDGAQGYPCLSFVTSDGALRRQPWRNYASCSSRTQQAVPGREGQVGEFPLFRERRGEPHFTQLFFHYICHSFENDTIMSVRIRGYAHETMARRRPQ